LGKAGAIFSVYRTAHNGQVVKFEQSLPKLTPGFVVKLRCGLRSATRFLRFAGFEFAGKIGFEIG
jgi:hypothetical protein